MKSLLRWTGITAVTLLPIAANATNDETVEMLYDRAIAAAQEGRNEAAAVLFDEVVKQALPAHPLLVLALYGAARSNERVGSREASCRAAERFKTFIGMPEAEAEKRERAAKVLGEMTLKCAAQAPEANPAEPEAPSPPLPQTPSAPPQQEVVDLSVKQDLVERTDAVPSSGPDRKWAWIATSAAVASFASGAYLLRLATDEIDAGNSAMQRFEASNRTSIEALNAVRSADDRVTTFAQAGYAVLGVGVLLGGLASWLWLREPRSEAAWIPTPKGLQWTITF